MSKRALISVSDKTGIAEFAKALVELGYEILSTGGTQKALAEAGVEVTGVEEVTEFPECFAGRVKTMHPKIMGGVLMRPNNKDDVKEAKANGIEPIEIVVVNLYPFEETAAKENVKFEEMIEQIDIGGPTLLRSAAKNHAHVTVITDPADYERVLGELKKSGETTPDLRQELALKVFSRTTQYDGAIAGALSEGNAGAITLSNGVHLRYGENPHQWGAYYDVNGGQRDWSIVQEGEKKMSYLNLLDADGAWKLVYEFTEPTAACIKHANPSGVASDSDIAVAFQKSYDADKLSAFGVIIALNRPCPKAVIEKIIEQEIFTEVIIAPGYDDDAKELLKSKPKIRALEMHTTSESALSFRPALGGALVQEEDSKVMIEADLTCVTDTKPTKEQTADLLFAWQVVKHTKSNAIVFAKDQTTVGIGCGQTSRVDCAVIAAYKAGGREANGKAAENLQGSAMASDAFFPFPDSVEEAAKHGVTAIIQPGGSVKDDEVIAKANELGIVMVTTGVRAFKH